MDAFDFDATDEALSSLSGPLEPLACVPDEAVLLAKQVVEDIARGRPSARLMCKTSCVTDLGMLLSVEAGSMTKKQCVAVFKWLEDVIKVNVCDRDIVWGALRNIVRHAGFYAREPPCETRGGAGSEAGASEPVDYVVSSSFDVSAAPCDIGCDWALTGVLEILEVHLEDHEVVFMGCKAMRILYECEGSNTYPSALPHVMVLVLRRYLHELEWVKTCAMWVRVVKKGAVLNKPQTRDLIDALVSALKFHPNDAHLAEMCAAKFKEFQRFESNHELMEVVVPEMSTAVRLHPSSVVLALDCTNVFLGLTRVKVLDSTRTVIVATVYCILRSHPTHHLIAGWCTETLVQLFVSGVVRVEHEVATLVGVLMHHSRERFTCMNCLTCLEHVMNDPATSKELLLGDVQSALLFVAQANKSLLNVPSKVANLFEAFAQCPSTVWDLLELVPTFVASIEGEVNQEGAVKSYVAVLHHLASDARLTAKDRDVLFTAVPVVCKVLKRYAYMEPISTACFTFLCDLAASEDYAAALMCAVTYIADAVWCSKHVRVALKAAVAEFLFRISQHFDNRVQLVDTVGTIDLILDGCARDRDPLLSRTCVAALKNISCHPGNADRFFRFEPTLRRELHTNLWDCQSVLDCVIALGNFTGYPEYHPVLLELVPYMRCALLRHPDSTDLTKACAAVFASLAANTTTARAVAEVVPVLTAAMARFPKDACLTEACVGVFQELAESPVLYGGVMCVVPTLLAALKEVPFDFGAVFRVMLCFERLARWHCNKATLRRHVPVIAMAASLCTGHVQLDTAFKLFLAHMDEYDSDTEQHDEGSTMEDPD